MKKYTFALLLFSFLYLGASAQKQNTYFIKNNGQYVTQRDSADFIRIVQEPEKDSKLFLTREYYKDGTKKAIGLSAKIDPPKYEGIYIAYYKNGKTKQVANYKNGQLTDTVYNYYPNGRLYSTLVYTAHSNPSEPAYDIKTLNDSTGNTLVADGNGQCNLYDNDFNRICERGTVKNGKREGVWTGEDEKQKFTYTETYAAGKLISGESKDDKNVVTSYTNAFVQPEFKGGMKQFYQFLGKNIRYPRNCITQRIQGVVLLNFIVEKDGTLNHIRVVNYADTELAAEAVRVLKSSPNWNPGAMRGRIVNVSYNVPVSFALN
jgi:TonB family protein